MEMSKGKLLSCLLGLMFAAISTSGAAAQGVLTVGTEGDAPPYSMADASGNVTGFDADVARSICAKLDVTCKFVVQAFDTLIPALDAKRFDIIISGLGITEERKKKIGYSIPYASAPQYFIVSKGSPLAKFTSLPPLLAALKGKSIGVVTGTTYSRYIAKNIPDATIKSYDSLTQMESDLSAKRFDAAFDDGSSWTDYLKKPEGASFEVVPVKVVATDDPSTLGHGMGVGIRKDDQELTKKIDVALCDIIKSGQMKTMSEKWFSDDYSLTCK
jgi:octopine/nopaline transport system substrate-binding protein